MSATLECGDLSPLSQGDVLPSNCGRRRDEMGRSRLAPAAACSRDWSRTEVRRRQVACAKAVTSHRTPKPSLCDDLETVRAISHCEHFSFSPGMTGLFPKSRCTANHGPLCELIAARVGSCGRNLTRNPALPPRACPLNSLGRQAAQTGCFLGGAFTGGGKVELPAKPSPSCANVWRRHQCSSGRAQNCGAPARSLAPPPPSCRAEEQGH